MRRGTFTSAGPVRVRKPNPDGEVESYVQPPYPPKAYWQAVNGRKRDSEHRELASHTSKKASLARRRLQRKIAAGTEGLQQVIDKRSSGQRQG